VHLPGILSIIWTQLSVLLQIISLRAWVASTSPVMCMDVRSVGYLCDWFVLLWHIWKNRCITIIPKIGRVNKHFFERLLSAWQELLFFLTVPTEVMFQAVTFVLVKKLSVVTFLPESFYKVTVWCARWLRTMVMAATATRGRLPLIFWYISNIQSGCKNFATIRATVADCHPPYSGHLFWAENNSHVASVVPIQSRLCSEKRTDW